MRWLAPIAVVASLALSAPVAAAERWAIVIGVGAHDDAGLSTRPGAVADAEAMRDWLLTRGGLPASKVLFLADGGDPRLEPHRPSERIAPTRANVRLALLRWFGDRARPDDSIVVYWAGASAADAGQAMLLPADANRVDLEGTAIDAAWIARTLGDHPALAIYETGAALPATSLDALRPARGAAWLSSSAGPATLTKEGRGRFTEVLLGALREETVAAKLSARLTAALGVAKPFVGDRGLPDGFLLATVAPPAVRPVLVLQDGHPGAVTGVAIDSRGNKVATLGADGIRIWDAKVKRLLAHRAGKIDSLAFVPGEETLLYAENGRVVLFDTASATTQGALSFGDPAVKGPVSVGASGTTVIAAAADGSFATWNRLDRTRTARAAVLATENGRAPAVALSRNGGSLAVRDEDHVIFADIGAKAKFRSTPSRAFALDPVSPRIAVGSSDGSIRLVELATETVVATLAPPEQDNIDHRIALLHARLGDADAVDRSSGGAVSLLAFHPGGRLVAATWALENEIRLLDAAGGGDRAILTGHTADVTGLSFTGDGKVLVSSSSDGTTRFWDVDAELSGRSGFWKGPGGITAVSFSPDGTRIAAIGGDGRVVVRDVATGKAVADFVVEGARALQFDAAQRLVISGRTVERRHGPGYLTADDLGRAGGLKLALNKDGTIACVPEGMEIVVREASPNGRERGRFPATDGAALSLSLSPDGGRVAVVGFNGTVREWDVSAGTDRVLSARADRIARSAVFDSHGRLAIGDDKGTIRVHDGTRVSLLRTWAPGYLGTTIRALAFGPGDALLAAGGFDGSIRIWDMNEHVVVASTAARNDIGALAFSPDGTRLAVGELGGVRILDVTALRASPPLTGHTRPVTAVAFGPRGDALVTAGDDRTVKRWNLIRGGLSAVHESARVPTRLELRKDDVAIAADEGIFGDQTPFAWNESGEDVPDVKWSPPTAAETRALEVVERIDLRSEMLRILGGSGKVAVSESMPDRFAHELAGNVVLRRMDGTEVVTLRVDVKDIAAHGRVLAVACGDGTVRLFDFADGTPLASLVELDRGKEWAVTTPEGLFDGSPGALKRMEWRVGDSFFALDQFFNAFYTPGLLAQIVRGDRPRARGDFADVKLPPDVEILPVKPSDISADGTVEVGVRYRERGGGIRHRWLYVNGHRLPEARAIALGKNTAKKPHATFRVGLVEGLNKIRATAWSEDGSIESRGAEIELTWEVPADTKPVLHVLGVGVDEYRAGLRLSFARADAQAISRFFKPGLFASVRPLELANAQATRKGILDALTTIAKEAKPRDTVLVYLAGHGALVGEVFYFLPNDVSVANDEEIRRTAISQIELGDALAAIPATKQLLVLDACHSGAAAGTLGRLLARRDAVGLGRAQRVLARSSGAFLIAASKADQYAHEVPALGHGILTWAILDALGEDGTPAADRDATGSVTVNALLRHVSATVPDLQEKYGGGRQDVVQASSGQDFPLANRAGNAP